MNQACVCFISIFVIAKCTVYEKNLETTKLKKTFLTPHSSDFGTTFSLIEIQRMRIFNY